MTSWLSYLPVLIESFVIFIMLRIEFRVLCMLGKHSVTKPCLQPQLFMLYGLIVLHGLMKDTAGALVLVIGMYVSPKDENPIGEGLAASGVFHMEWQTWEALLIIGLDSIVRHRIQSPTSIPLPLLLSIINWKGYWSENLAWSLYFLRFTSNNECGFQVSESFIDQVWNTLNIWYFSLYITC